MEIRENRKRLMWLAVVALTVPAAVVSLIITEAHAQSIYSRAQIVLD